MARSRAPKRTRRCMVAVRYRGAMTRAEALFEEELRRRGVLFVRSDVSTYEIVLGDGRVTVSLENVARDLERDDDPDRLVRFADSVLGTLVPLPGWDAARENVYWIVEDRAHDLIGVVHEALTEGVVRILAHADFEAGRIRWLTPRSIADWNVEPADVSKAAWQNLDRALASAELHVEGDGEVSLGILVMPDRLTEALKASLILAPAFEAFVATKLGWPVLAVIPRAATTSTSSPRRTRACSRRRWARRRCTSIAARDIRSRSRCSASRRVASSRSVGFPTGAELPGRAPAT